VAQLERVQSKPTSVEAARLNAAAGSRRPSLIEAVSRPLLHLPLFYKLIVANVAILLLAVLASSALAARAIRAQPHVSTTVVILPVALAAVFLSASVNALLVRLALRPLDQLGETARRVQAGDHAARARPNALADAQLEQLTATFNAMLEGLAAQRHRSRELAVRALEAGESERKRIAAELHDGVAQSLAAVLLQLRVAQKAKGEAGRSEMLSRISEQLAALTEELRAIARGLRPPALDMLGLVAALQAHGRLLAESSNLRLEVRGSGLDLVLPPEAELALYRLVQEALSNVVRHSQARTATVDLESSNGVVRAIVRDDGRGFHVDEALARGRGLGLFGMHERASYVGGQVVVSSEPGRGTTVRIEFPVDGTTSYV
jgi:signal transduction histidine kinase